MGLPFIVWMAPFALYMVVFLRRQVPSAGRRALLVTVAFAGNILLLVGYALALSSLDRLQRARFMEYADRCMREHLAEACPSGYPIFDPPPPPLHWEWAMVCYVFAAAGLYFLLHVIEQRMVRREAKADQGSTLDAPGA
jgi:hypothetical protein